MTPLQQPSKKAFTLIEVLLAVAIFAMVLAAINGVFYGAMRLRSKTARLFEESLPMQQTLAIIKRDLQGLVAPGGALSGVLQTGTSTTGMEQQSALEIYTATGVADEVAPWANVQKVSYNLRAAVDRTAAGKDLVRMVTRNLLATTQEEAEEQWLMGDVERVEFLFYDGAEWRNSWDSTTETTVLPRAIKVQIAFAVNRDEPRTRTPVQLVVPIVVQGRTNGTAQATGGQQ